MTARLTAEQWVFILGGRAGMAGVPIPTQAYCPDCGGWTWHRAGWCLRCDLEHRRDDVTARGT